MLGRDIFPLRIELYKSVKGKPQTEVLKIGVIEGTKKRYNNKIQKEHKDNIDIEIFWIEEEES